jgi:phosphoribosylformylglycinamidine synthase
LIPGAAAWPKFLRNRSDQFEARLSLVEIVPSESILLAGMAGSRIPIVTAHGEGRAAFATADDFEHCDATLAVLRFVTNAGAVAETYPANPNGSPHGIAALCNADGRVTIMMPHPERVFRTTQLSWHPREWGECSPWQQMFDNARVWVRQPGSSLRDRARCPRRRRAGRAAVPNGLRSRHADRLSPPRPYVRSRKRRAARSPQGARALRDSL